MSFTTLAPLESRLDGEAQQVHLDGRVLAVIRLGNEVYVLNDRCSHEDFSLALGEVEPDDLTIECARHGALFSLETGDPVTFPATQPVAAYQTRVVDGLVEVELP